MFWGYLKSHATIPSLKYMTISTHKQINHQSSCTRRQTTDTTISWVALLVLRYLSNTASVVVYGITCLIRLIEFAAWFTTFEEHTCVRQVVLDKRFPLYIHTYIYIYITNQSLSLSIYIYIYLHLYIQGCGEVPGSVGRSNLF